MNFTGRIKKIGLRFGRMRITVDPLLPLVIILMSWVLSERYYPQIMFTQATWVYWLMGVSSSLFLTLSILVHEYGHALAARWQKLPLERIHLYLFGGMAELKQRPSRPAEELIIALSGPLASLMFAGLAWWLAGTLKGVSGGIYLVLQFVIYMNLLLCGFNLLPIFPLDGGRALRALLWRHRRFFYGASILAYYISIGFIFLILIAALVVAWTDGWSTAVWIALLAVYLWYTAYVGRDELISQPRFEDLIFRIDDERSPVAVIRQLNRMDRKYVSHAIIPVGREGALESVVLGRKLSGIPNEDESIEHLYEPVHDGSYVDISDEKTFHPGNIPKADYIPVLDRGEILGMSDAHEIRFWLWQHKKAGFPPGSFFKMASSDLKMRPESGRECPEDPEQNR